MTQMIPYAEKLKTMRTELLRSKSEIVKGLPVHLEPDRMFRLYLTCAQVTPRLAECTPISVVGAVMQAAQLGLSLETVLGEAYLIPRWNKNTRGHVAHFQIGYKGLRKLARQADIDLRDIYADPVFQKDIFDYERGLNPTLTHKPAKGARGALVAAYAVACWKDDYKRFFVADTDTIQRAMQSSDAYLKSLREGTKNSPWHTHPEAMWCKTALIRLCGQMTLSSDSLLARALVAEEHSGETLRTSIKGETPDIMVMPIDTTGESDDDGVVEVIESEQTEQPKQDAKPKTVLDAVVEKEKAANGGSAEGEAAPAAERRRRPRAQAPQQEEGEREAGQEG